MGDEVLDQASAGHFIVGSSRRLCQLPEEELHLVGHEVWLYDGPTPRRSTSRCDECLTRRELQRRPRWMWPLVRAAKKRREQRV